MLMRPYALAITVPFLLLAGCQRQQDRPIAEIQKVGGSVELDEHAPDKPLVAVDIHGSDGADALLRRLENQTQLRRLDLGGTDVTDAGLAPLSALTELEELNLSTTRIG